MKIGEGVVFAAETFWAWLKVVGALLVALVLVLLPAVGVGLYVWIIIRFVRWALA